MTSVRLNNMAITTNKKGSGRRAKSGFPMRYGTYSEIRTPEYEFHFNLKGEIKFIRGLNVTWPHPSELLKRTDGNDWIYYSVGTVGERIFDWLGEYYLPCLTYSSNAIWEFNPFTDANVMTAFGGWSQLYADLFGISQNRLPAGIKEFLSLVFENGESALHESSEKLRSVIGGRVSVLPPDTRHVDYEVIPLMIADGCLYRCGFCGVKSDMRFHARPKDDVLLQIRELKAFYDRNLVNYNALFLGNHDALQAGEERILPAVSEAIPAFEFDTKQNPNLYLFGSVDSLLNAGNGLFEALDRTPFYTYINIGFESVDESTLAMIKKPLDESKVRAAFQKMLEINRDHANIEITGNFILGEHYPPGHTESLTELLADVPEPLRKKGAIYLSPLMASRKKLDLLKLYYEIKDVSRLPAHVYLIQRL